MHVSSIRPVGVSKSAAVKGRCIYKMITLSSRPSLARPLRSPITQARSLWWWSRRGNEWSTCLDEHLQDRAQREQKIMRYKYSKALRRRALWDTEASHPRSDWQLARRWIRRRLLRGEHLSSSSRIRNKAPETAEDDRPFTRPMENQYSEEFAKFRAAIDKDPFGAVFGRRLESPPSPNNSSWTSLAWIFEPFPVRNTSSIEESPSAGPKTAEEKANESGPKATTVTSHEPASTSIPIKNAVAPPVPVAAEEYEFDPISMRKVPKAEYSVLASAPLERKPFLSSLFAEHGIDIPVKTYKPHKVYGYTEKGSKASQPEKKTKTAEAEAAEKKSQSFRIQELRRLKAAKLGNAIDATNFCAKYERNDDEIGSVKPEETKPLVSEQLEDDAPLFSGTTYQFKSQSIVPAESANTSAAAAASNKDWLTKEGFCSPVSPTGQLPPTRSHADIIKTGSNAKPIIEPALDRIQRPTIEQHQNQRSPKKIVVNEIQKDRAEDLDLLRPSDVRAQSKTARKTKLDAKLDKEESRQRLEADYISSQSNNDEAEARYPDAGAGSTSKLQDGLSKLWKRVRDQPQYSNLANTIKNMGVFQDVYKNYTRDKIIEDPTEKLVFKDRTLSKTPSIYKTTPKISRTSIDTFTPSNEVLEAEQRSQQRTSELRSANELAKKKAQEEGAQFAALAAEMRNAYESQYGAIDINHRQSASNSRDMAIDAEENKILDANKPQKQTTPETEGVTSKIAEDPSTTTRDSQKTFHNGAAEKANRSSFQTELDRVVDEVRNTRRVLHEVSLNVRAIKSRRPPTYWNTLITEVSANGSQATVDQNTSQTQKLPTEACAVPDKENSTLDVPEEITKRKAAEDIAAYTASVVSANRSAARAQALQDLRMRRTNRVQAMEKEAVEASAQEPEGSVITESKIVNNDLDSEPVVIDTPASSHITEPTPPTQASSPTPAPTAHQTPALYKVLAYDSSTLQISIATTTSSLPVSTSGNGDVEPDSHPMVVLSRLNSPAKFLPYFQEMQDQGYEIVSGSGDILVFKKVRDAASSVATETLIQVSTEAHKENLPVQQEAATVVDNFPSKPAPAPTAPSPPASPIVRRQEDVFSGAGQTWHQERSQSPEQSSSATDMSSEEGGTWSKVKRGTKRVFLTGLVTAGVAYAIGAVAESFGAQSPSELDVGDARRRGGRAGIYSTESSR